MSKERFHDKVAEQTEDCIVVPHDMPLEVRQKLASVLTEAIERGFLENVKPTGDLWYKPSPPDDTRQEG